MAYAANFEIYREYPRYCQITDGLIGSGYQKLSMTYSNEALAHKIAERLSKKEYEEYGDDHFVVVKIGESPWKPRFYNKSLYTEKDAAIDDEIPF